MVVHDYRNTLAFLFDLMIRLQKASDQGNFGVLETVRLSEAMTDYIYGFPELSAYRAFMIEKIYEDLQGGDGQGDDRQDDDAPSLDFSFVPSSQQRGIFVAINQGITTVEIASDINPLSDAANTTADIQLSLYPGVFSSVPLTLTPGMVLLMPTVHRPQAALQWHLVTMIDKVTARSLIGFVHGYIDVNNRFFISADENSVRVNQAGLPRQHRVDIMRDNKRLWIFYAVMVLLVCALILRRKV